MASTNFRPLHEPALWFVALSLKLRPRVASSFLIPPREKPQEGEIVAVGSRRTR